MSGSNSSTTNTHLTAMLEYIRAIAKSIRNRRKYNVAYTIGVGILLEKTVSNKIRDIQMEIADKLGITQGLGQSPHIAIKRSFQVSSLAEIKAVEKVMHGIAKKTKPFEVQFDGLGNFSDKVLYLKVDPNDALKVVHARCLEAINLLSPHSQGLFEGDRMVFHSTLSLGLEQNELNRVKKLLGQNEPAYTFTTHVSEVGLFLSLDNNSHWAIIKKFDLK